MDLKLTSALLAAVLFAASPLLDGKTVRSQHAKVEFKRSNPCPANGASLRRRADYLRADDAQARPDAHMVLDAVHCLQGDADNELDRHTAAQFFAEGKHDT